MSRAKGDRRGAYAAITSDGRAKLAEMWPVYERCLADHFAPALTAPQARALTDALTQVAQSVRAARR